jgi:flagellar hook-associated protein 3 FlgL
MLSRGVLDDVAAASARLTRTQQKLSSGKELNRPSDDPSAVARSIEMRNVIEGAQQHQRTVGEAQGWADVTDSALETINDGLQRIRELTLQGANGALDSGQRDALEPRGQGRHRVDQGRGQRHVRRPLRLRRHAHRRAAVRRRLGHLRRQRRPHRPRDRPGVTIPINITGERRSAAAPRASSASCAAWRPTWPRTTRTPRHRHRRARPAPRRAQRGARQGRRHRQPPRGRRRPPLRVRGHALRVLSDNEDADMAKAMIDFSIQQAALQAGLKAGAQVVQNSLLDFLR